MRKTKVLFLCTQNSARSQMAEALLRMHGGEEYEAHSAGVSAAGEIHPYAIRVMEEIGADMSGHRPKGLREYMGKMGFNYLVIVCSRAEQNCPSTFPGVGTRLVWLFDDPRNPDAPEEDRIEKFREARDEIELKIKDWLDHPEAELEKLKAEREEERKARLEFESSDRA